MPGPSDDALAARYERIAAQLAELFEETADPQARMATAVSLLHHKLPHFFWTGFYRLVDGDLGPGEHHRAWDGRDSRGRPVAGGVYFARAEAGNWRPVVKMVVAK